MENKFFEIIDSLPTLIRNTHLNITMEGWPATVTTIALCGTGIAFYALKLAHTDNSNNTLPEAA